MPMLRVKLATRWLTPTFSMVFRSTVGNVTAELVVVTATMVCSTSLLGRFIGLSRVSAETTTTKIMLMMSTPSRVVPK